MTNDDELLERQIAEWRTYLERGPAMVDSDVEELEGHLRDQIDGLRSAGLDPDEAFLVGVKRIGSLSALSREFAREHSDRLWRQLVLGSEAAGAKPVRRETILVLLLAVAAAIAIKVPELFGIRLQEGGDDFYARNLSFFVLPFLTVYLAWKRGLGTTPFLGLLLPFVATALVVNLYPFHSQGHTLYLSAIHLPVALWLVVGLGYVGLDWRNSEERMHFIRFSGELFIYYVLIALGGGVLAAFTGAIFQAIGIDAGRFIGQWLVPCGAMGAVLIGAWLVEAKQGVIENMAPVLTRIFTPLFTLVLLAFLTTMVWTNRGIDVEREVLIGFDLLLVVVLGLLVYAISARDRSAGPGLFDVLQLVLVASALIVDGVALAAILSRISEFGFTPNRTAALGENLILLVNLGWSAWLYLRFVRGGASIDELERWQTSYLPVYAFWALVVVVLFPILFRFA
ncbi:MAG: permease prefix domain 1-containing protein [Candidatus Eisenbacteria bacterium]